MHGMATIWRRGLTPKTIKANWSESCLNPSCAGNIVASDENYSINNTNSGHNTKPCQNICKNVHKNVFDDDSG